MKTAGTILFGMKAICEHTGFNRHRIEKAVRERDFPAALVDGRWQSNTQLIDEWHVREMRRCTVGSGSVNRQTVRAMR